MRDTLLKCLICFLLAYLNVCCLEKAKLVDTSEIDLNKVNGLTQNQDKQSWEQLYFKEITAKINEVGVVDLKNLELVGDSKEIRVWVGFSTDPLRGLILKQQNEASSSLFAPPLYHNSSSPRPFYSLASPKSGWSQLWKKLEKLEIMTLPDLNDTADVDGGSVVIEIKTSNSYRTYRYSSVTVRNSEHHKRVLKICNTLTDEFGVQLIKYYPEYKP